MVAITIGRDPSNSVQVEDPLVSRHHARVERQSSRQTPGTSTTARLVDLDSFRGTFVNGEVVRGSRPLETGDVITVGNHRLLWTGHDLEPAPADDSPVLEAERLSVVKVDGKRLLSDVSLALRPGTLTAVIGPSGAGKTTLLNALTGLRPATHGAVRYLGADLYENYNELRPKIGLVPQQDIQHHQLTTAQALTFSAELRLLPDATGEERDETVRAVAGRLQLLDRMDNRIGTQLSGGQRKRVSIATELLTAPPLLFLDEPTSGLDPGLDVGVMRQLRELADEGRVIVVVTHSVLALDTCDQVVVLAPGGLVAYDGAPDGLFEHFGCRTVPEVFAHLDRMGVQSADSTPLPPATTRAVATPSWRIRPFADVRRDVAKAQVSTLLRRNVAVLRADRLLFAMLLILPVVLGLLTRVVPGQAGLSLLEAPLAPGGYLNSEQASKRVTILIVAAVLMGSAMSIRELVGERPIFQREHAVGLSADVYLASKAIVMGIATFVQGIALTFIATWGEPGPDFKGDLRSGRIELALTIGLLAMSMSVLGLCLSALVGSTEQTMPALVGVVMVQFVLSGALVAVHGRPILSQVSWLAPARWAYAACASTLSLQRPQRAQGADLDWVALHGWQHWLMNVSILAALTIITAWLAILATRRSATAR